MYGWIRLSNILKKTKTTNNYAHFNLTSPFAFRVVVTYVLYNHLISLWFPSKWHRELGVFTLYTRRCIVLPNRRATTAASTRNSASLTRWYGTFTPSASSLERTDLNKNNRLYQWWLFHKITKRHMNECYEWGLMQHVGTYRLKFDRVTSEHATYRSLSLLTIYNLTKCTC